MVSGQMISKILEISNTYEVKGERISNRKIEQLLAIIDGPSHQTIGTIRKKFSLLNLSLDELSLLTAKSVHQLFYPEAYQYYGRTEILDLHDDVAQLLSSRHVTANYLYKQRAQNDPTTPSRSSYYKQIKHVLNKQKVTMKQFHCAGEFLFIDYAGKRLNTKSFSSLMFMSALGFSKCIFPYATPRQTNSDWLGGLNAAVMFFGGFTEFIGADNDCALVKVHGKSKEPIALLQAFSNHYGWPIHFARSNSPQDKAIVEKRIKDFYSFIYPKAEELYFDSYDDLNAWLADMAMEFNNIKTQGEQCSPYDKYLDYEKEALMKVEVPPFNSLLECKRCKVPTDYYLKVDDHFYMVPYDLKGTWVRFELYDKKVKFYQERRLVAEYSRSNEVGGFSCKLEFMEPSHRFMAEQNLENNLKWASKIGKPLVIIVQSIYATTSNPNSIPAAKHCNVIKKLYRRLVPNNAKDKKKLFLQACKEVTRLGGKYAPKIERYFHILQNEQDM
tara:strand:- start:652 stop:2151 length:1500 start_codon:yes stop_codon:yes gene_type:complete